MASLMPNGKQQYMTSAGAPLSGGKVFTYAEGTTTPKATYSDQAGTIANLNPIILNARGEALIYWAGNYKVVVKDAQDNLIYTVDGYRTASNSLGDVLTTKTGVSFVQNIAALRLLSPTAQPQQVSVAYHTVQGDGARIYSWDAGCTIADNNDGVIKAAPATGRFIQSNEGTLSPTSDANNLPALNSALSLRKLSNLPEMDILVTTNPVNPLGYELDGFGRVLKPIAGGNQQLNLQVDKGQHVFGQEYLSAFHNKLIARVPAPIIVFSGDSTTAGDAVTSSNQIGFLTQQTINDAGFIVTQINSGLSGGSSNNWITRITADLASNPDLYVIRWGINDGIQNDINAYAANIRQGLATIRASKNVSQLSILLMTPNSTSDTPQNRDEKWYEQIRLVLRQAARDYNCAFIDTYSLWADSRPAAGVWMDDAYGDGRAIHPLAVMNKWIASKIADFIVPSAFRNKNVLDDPLAQLNINTAPEYYPLGTSMYKAVWSGETWFVIVNRSANGGIKQELIKTAPSNRSLLRYGFVGSGWFDWANSDIGNLPTLQNGYGNYAGAEGKYTKNNGQVFLSGILTSGTLTAGTLITTLPVGFRPSYAGYLKVLTGNPVTTAGILGIGVDGKITAVGVLAGYVDLTGVSFSIA